MNQPVILFKKISNEEIAEFQKTYGTKEVEKVAKPAKKTAQKPAEKKQEAPEEASKPSE